MNSEFVGILKRANNINRWGLMSQFKNEVLSAHIYETTIISHVLGVIAKEKFGEDISPDKVASMAAFHEASESYCGDIPSTAKYKNPRIAQAMKVMEREFEESLLQTLPPEFQELYRPYIAQDKSDPHALLAKAADVIAAYAKCQFELSKGNDEFSSASEEIAEQLSNYQTRLPAVEYFCEHFLEGMFKTVDEQAKSQWVSVANDFNIRKASM